MGWETRLALKLYQYQKNIVFEVKFILVKAQFINIQIALNTQPILMQESFQSQLQADYSFRPHHQQPGNNGNLSPKTHLLSELDLTSDKDILIDCVNFLTVNENLEIEANLLYSNGSPIRIHTRYLKVYQQFFQKPNPHGRNVVQYYYFNRDEFVIKIKFPIKFQGGAAGVLQQDYKLIKQNILLIKKFLIFIGLLKSKSRFQYQMQKNMLKLKKQVTQILLDKQNPPKLSMCQPLQSKNESIHQIISASEVQNPQKQKCMPTHLKSPYNRINVQKKLLQVTYPDYRKEKLVLVEKKLRDKLKEYLNNQDQYQQYLKKLQYQIQFVRKINNDKYLVDYYLNKQEQGREMDKFYMKFVEMGLKNTAYKNNFSITQLLQISKQLIEAVQILHDSNIVHRDLKMENILLEEPNAGQIKLKLIDFGQCCTIGAPYVKDHNLGSTLPYSPIECMLDLQQGYNNPAIDYWSIIFIIYEMMFKDLPVYFSRQSRNQIIQGWKSEGSFSIFVRIGKRNGFRMMEQIIGLMAEQGLKIEQNERLKLTTSYKIICALQKFQQEMKNAVIKFI